MTISVLYSFVFRLFLILSAYLIVHGDARTFIWTKLDQELINDEGYGTSDFSTGVIGSDVYIYGGWTFTQTGQIQFNNIHELNSKNNTLVEITNLMHDEIPYIEGASMTRVNNSTFFIAGGQSGQFYINSTYWFNPIELEWTEGNSLPITTGWHSANEVNGRIFMYGGWDADANIDRATLIVYNITSDIYTVYEDQPPYRREGHASAVVGDTIWIYGGTCFNCALGDQENPNTFYNDVWTLNTATLEWKKINITGGFLSYRAFHSMTLFYGNLFIFGGGYIDPSYLSYIYNDLVMLNTTSCELSTVTVNGSPPDARWSHQAAATTVGKSEKLYIMGGLYFSSFSYKDIFVIEEGCSAGYYRNKSLQTCLPCKQGYYSSAPGAFECSECVPGTYSHGAATNCSYCPLGTYNPFNTQSSCLTCPEYSTTVIKASDDIANCICKLGYYGQNGDCSPCPTGSTCTDLGTETPTILDGYWMNKDYGYDFLYQCYPSLACTQGVCAKGYSGRRCGSCELGYYKIGFNCKECNSHASGLAVFIFILPFLIVVVMLLIANHSKKFNSGMLTISVDFLQVISLFSKFDMSWPNPGIYPVLSSFSLINLNIDLFGLECYNMPHHYQKWLLQLFIPFYMAIYFLCGYAATVLYNWHFRTLDMRRWKNMFIHGYVILISYLYPFLATLAIDNLRCKKDVDSTYFLYPAPSVICFDHVWWDYFPISVIAILIYLIGIPLGFALFLRYYKYKLDTVTFRARFGAIYMAYKSHRYWWGSVVFIRKILIILPTLITLGHMWDAFFAVFPLYCSIFLFAMINPYQIEHVNKMQLLLNASLFALLFLGMLNDSGRLGATGSYVLAGVSFAILSVSFSVIVLSLVRLFRETKFYNYLVEMRGQRRVGPTIELPQVSSEGAIAGLRRISSTESRSTSRMSRASSGSRETYLTP